MRGRVELVVAEATAAEFHARPVPEPARPAVWSHRIVGSALVLGSTQPDDVADAAACRDAGIDVVRRRSGGGAVLLVPGRVHWIDVIVPRDGDGWSRDVHAPMVWLGRLLATVMETHGVTGVEVHEGPMRSTTHSGLICFDGLGPGEVTVAGAKLIGMSQRRTRDWARLQCCWYSRYDHGELVALLSRAVAPPHPDRLGAVATVDAEIGDRVAADLHRLLDA